MALSGQRGGSSDVSVKRSLTTSIEEALNNNDDPDLNSRPPLDAASSNSLLRSLEMTRLKPRSPSAGSSPSCVAAPAPRPSDGGDKKRQTPILEEEGDHDQDLISTLQEGLAIRNCLLEDAAAEEDDGGDEPHRWSLDAGPRLQPFSLNGQPVDLPVSSQDSLSYRIEALRVFLEQEIGLEAFLCLHRYLNDRAADPASVVSAAPSDHQLESLVPAKAIEYLPLVTQLIVCEDACFSSVAEAPPPSF